MVRQTVGGGRRGRLFRKYVVISMILVSGALLTSGLLEIYFSYEENRSALVQLQHEKAAGAAFRITQFVGETRRQMDGAIPPPVLASATTLEQRRNDFLRLLRQAGAITEVSYLDGDGREQLRVSRLAMNVTGSQDDYSSAPRFREAQDGATYYGPVYFRNESEPYMTISVGDRRPSAGVTAAEVNLKFIWDVVSQIRVGDAGYAYVTDADGHLIAHPDISLVLQKMDLSSLPQVAAARAGTVPGSDQTSIGRDPRGREVLSTHQPIQPVGWHVFVEQPSSEAFAPLYASALRTVLLVLFGLVLSVVASLVLARRMVTPIQALQASAARIGSGALDERIDVRTGDELESLADQFNDMTAQLRESYATLEQKVELRTRELEEKSDQLEVANRHKSEFLANMSHELRTPLNAIIGFSEVLLERMFGDINDRQEEYLRDILSSGRHLLSLINDILDLSKVEAGRMELELETFVLGDVLESGLTMMRERANRHGISLSLDLDPSMALVVADERKVKQVFFNLLSNAVKFTPDGGSVDVSATLVGGEVQIAVRDTGIGIAPDEQGLVFEEFRQAGRPSTQRLEGTGLGLALSKRFVELHGGRIWVESRLGVGSTFTFTLPLSTPDAVESNATDPTVPSIASDGRGASPVLVVEDDEASIRLLTLHLSGAGLDVAVARDGEQGLELARTARPAGIVLDILLPKIDGWDLLERLKADPTLADIPVIIVSMLDERGKGFALGAADYLVKPVKRDDLLASLRRIARIAGATTLLAIDDDPLAVELIRATFEPRGYTVLAASGGAEGVALARTERPAVVILDLMMPEVDGFAVVDLLKADPTTADIPIVVLTAKAMTVEEKHRLNGRISHLARKGEFDRAMFVDQVRRLCEIEHRASTVGVDGSENGR